jgi:hypothetical protein
VWLAAGIGIHVATKTIPSVLNAAQQGAFHQCKSTACMTKNFASELSDFLKVLWWDS